MTEEEARQLREENAGLKAKLVQKDRRIEEVESRLVAALLRIEELERRVRMFDLLLLMVQATDQGRSTDAGTLAREVRDDLIAQYFDILAAGFAAHQSQAPPIPHKQGRRKQDASKNLLDALLKRAQDVLAFLDDLTLPFTNNLAERDLRMIKFQQKISGTFRSAEGATAFCVIRSYLSTMRKQGRSILAAMAAVFDGSPFSVAWGT